MGCGVERLSCGLMPGSDGKTVARVMRTEGLFIIDQGHDAYSMACACWISKTVLYPTVCLVTVFISGMFYVTNQEKGTYHKICSFPNVSAAYKEVPEGDQLQAVPTIHLVSLFRDREDVPSG